MYKLAIAPVFVALAGSVAHAQSIASFEARLSDSSLPTNAAMGWRSDAMAADGDRVVLGANGAQRAVLFERAPAGEWSMVATLSPPSAAAGFGISVAMQGDEIVVGAHQAASGGVSAAGTVFVYRRTTDGEWQLSQSIVPASPSNQLWFGGGVALDGDILAIGASGNAPGQGIYIYVRSQTGAWEHASTVFSPDSGTTDAGYPPAFGFPVRLSGDCMLTTDCARDVAGVTDAGRGYAFRRQPSGEWIPEARLDHPEPGTGDGVFGGFFYATNIAWGQSMAVLSFGSDDVSSNADQGSAHVFQRGVDGSWSYAASLVSTDGRAGDRMGWSTVRVIGDDILVGSVGWDGPLGSSLDVGRVVHFGRAGGEWRELTSIVDPSPVSGDRFGSGVAVGGGFLCIASHGRDGGRGCGVMFGFGGDCNMNAVADPLDILRGASDSDGDHVPDECECFGDVNGDGVIDGDDLGSLLNLWGGCAIPCSADLNHDGFVNGADLGLLLGNWGACT